MAFDAFLATEFFGNTMRRYLIALAIALVIFVGLWILDRYAIRWIRVGLQRTKFEWDDMLIEFLDALKWPLFLFIGIFVGARSLNLSPLIDRGFFIALLVVAGFYIAKGIGRSIDYIVRLQIKKRTGSDQRASGGIVYVFGFLAKMAVWVIVLLTILANFGVEITPLLAGLGVGGIAIGLALQAILGDLFSAFAIYFDKPFVEGDFIIIGSDMGVIKKIGVKSTRIETLQGQELIVSNSELTSTRVNNYKKMQKRRIEFRFGVEYSTPLKKLKKINEIVAKTIKDVELITLDRVHFKNFGDFSLIYEVVYYIDTPDYNKYMDVQQDINFRLKEAFEKEKIAFAFPTQTIFVEKA